MPVDTKTSPVGFRYRGLYGRDYHHTRLHTHTVKYSLENRIRAVTRCIEESGCAGSIGSVLDVGSADGLLAQGVVSVLSHVDRVYALDMDEQLLGHNPFFAIRADCSRMPFQDGSFDLISAAAVIEHLSKPHEFLRECRRVLKPGGLLILTCPAPFFDWVATKIGYLKDAGHVARYSLRGLKEICAGHGLETVVARKFMVSPFGFPGALLVEWSLSRMGLDFFMLNQVIGVRSRSGR